MLKYLINFTGNCFELYIANMFYSKVSKRRVSGKLFWVFNILLLLFQFLNNSLFLTKSVLVVVCSLCFFWLISLLYTMKWQKRLFVSFFLYCVSALSEVCVAMIFMTLLKVDLAYTQNNLILFAICTLTSKFFAFSILRLLKFKEKSNNNWIPVTLAFNTMPLPLSSFLILIVLFESCYRIREFGFQMTILIASILLTAANLLVFNIIDKQNDYIKTKQQLYFARNHIKNQISHYDELYRYQHDMRKYKHDVKNRLLALIGLLNGGNADKALAELKSDLDMLDKGVCNIVNTGNPIIDAVIQSKINIAKSKNIVIDISSKLTKHIMIDSLEMGVLLGNAIDNAIEATEKVCGKARNVYVSLITAEDILSIEIKNPVKSNIDTKSLLSQKSDKLNHGYGIKSIQTIAEKYNGHVSFACEDNIFSINIVLNNKTNDVAFL